jgi:hypothetical protein
MRCDLTGDGCDGGGRHRKRAEPEEVHNSSHESRGAAEAKLKIGRFGMLPPWCFEGPGTGSRTTVILSPDCGPRLPLAFGSEGVRPPSPLEDVDLRLLSTLARHGTSRDGGARTAQVRNRTRWASRTRRCAGLQRSVPHTRRAFELAPPPATATWSCSLPSSPTTT